MSRLRKLRRAAERVKLNKKIAADDQTHGCEKCRSDEKRTLLAKEMVQKGVEASCRVRCPDCGAEWVVSLFAAGPQGELHISFQPLKPKKQVLN